jgi:predicted DNA-binding ribbon-helix-helix protein
MTSGPTLTEARRRKLGGARMTLRLDAPVKRRLVAMAQGRGLTVAGLVTAWIGSAAGSGYLPAGAGGKGGGDGDR